jgi:hypothetical protein
MDNDNISEFSNNVFLVDADFVNKINGIQVKNIQVRPNWYTNLGQFYTDYIQPNLFALIAFIILSIFLIFRYFIKKDKKKQHLKKTLKRVLNNEQSKSEHKYELSEKEEDDYLDKYIDNLMENEEYNFGEENDEFQKNNDDDNQINKILKYYDDLEKSGITSSQYIEKEKENDIKKINFDHLAKLISGSN